MESLVNNKKLESRLLKVITENKPRSVKINGKSVYFSRKILNSIREHMASNPTDKEGGFLPFLIPLIISAIGAAGTAAGGIAAAVKAGNDASHNKVMEELKADEIKKDQEYKDKQLEIMNNIKSGTGIISDTLANAGSNVGMKIGETIEKTPQLIKTLGQHIVKGAKAPFKQVFSDLSKYFTISGQSSKTAEGSGFILNLIPNFGSGIFIEPKQGKGFGNGLHLPTRGNPSGNGLFIPSFGISNQAIPKDV